MCRPLLFLLLLFLILGNPVQADDEEAPLKIMLNGVVAGEYFVLIKSDGDVLVPLEDLQRMGIQIKEGQLRSKQQVYVSLKQWTPAISYRIEDKSLELHLTVEPSLLGKTVLDYGRPQQQQNLFGIDSAFVNYSYLKTGEGALDKSYRVPVEAVIKAHGGLLRGDFLLRGDQEYPYWTRGLVSLSGDNASVMRRWTLGDIVSSTGELGGGGIYMGLNLSRVFAMSPYFSRHPGVDVAGILDTPSRVDIYVNNMLIRSEHLPAGEFELNDLPNVYGSGNADVIITDAFGRSRNMSVPYYISSLMLKENVHEFNYTLGLRRKLSKGLHPTYEGQPSFLGFHRYGVNDDLTIGYRFELNDDLVNLGVGANRLLAKIGEFNGGYSLSHQGELDGSAAYMRYGFSSRYLHARASYRYLSQFYANANLDALDENRTWFFQSYSFGFHGTPLGAFSLNYDQRNPMFQSINRTYSLNYSRRIGRLVSFLLRLGRHFSGDHIETTVYTSISMVLGKKASANMAYTQTDENFTQNVYVAQSPPVGRGLGYRFRIGEDEHTRSNTNWLGDANVIFKTGSNIFNGNALKTRTDTAYQWSLAGSLAFIDNSLYLTRPIRDSFALVKAGRLDDVRVYYSSELVGSTDKGRLIVPNLTSYARNIISIEPQDIPVDYALENDRLVVSPALRTGGVARFSVEKFQGFTGNAYFWSQGNKHAAEYAELRLAAGSETIESIIGLRGEFYFENLSPGIYRGHLRYKGEQCNVELKVPQSEEMMVNVGEVSCVLLP